MTGLPADTVVEEREADCNAKSTKGNITDMVTLVTLLFSLLSVTLFK